ncbi:MAG: fumarylacetoacetate hydrolase family protein [Ancrocorticia populi]|uniref:fumarylacetoacetate hydrolase family protein n=1 Tax=Ancrocorticia populi TaxID=2175228 RepID=UPI003F918BB8
MKIARISLDQGPRYAILDEDTHQYLVLTDDPMFGKVEVSGQRIAQDEAQLLSPMIPRSKVVGYIGSYGSADTIEDLDMFLKPNTAVIGPDDPVILPSWAQTVRHEPELAVVISRACKDIPASRASGVIFGYTVANDVTAVAGDKARAKAFDTALPTGPVIETDLDVADLHVVSRVNGEVRREGRTSELAFSVDELVAYASTIFTLLPGDIILTGAPAGVGEIEAGDSVEVEVEGIGVVANPVMRRG